MNDENESLRSIADNLAHVRGRIRAACERSGRDPANVTLIAVSKTKPFSDVMEAWESGAADFGENYVQELTRKVELFDGGKHDRPIRWHMIGHLQRNKVKYLIGHTALIHSVDTVALAGQIEKEAAKEAQVVRVLLEVNIAREKSKWGFDPDAVSEAAKAILSLPHVRVVGLMTSAPITEDPERNRPYFRGLTSLAGQLAVDHLLSLDDPDLRGPVLSMGMTGDFEVAVEEGATMVRVGTAIFGKRN